MNIANVDNQIDDANERLGAAIRDNDPVAAADWVNVIRGLYLVRDEVPYEEEIV